MLPTYTEIYLLRWEATCMFLLSDVHFIILSNPWNCRNNAFEFCSYRTNAITSNLIRCFPCLEVFGNGWFSYLIWIWPTFLLVFHRYALLALNMYTLTSFITLILVSYFVNIFLKNIAANLLGIYIMNL